MSIKAIKKLNSDQLFDLQQVISGEIIRKVQKEYDDEKYPIKSRNDKLVCQVCGGRFTRHSKSQHDKGKKHKNRLIEIYENTLNIFY